MDKEQKILAAMRYVLAQVIKETTPEFKTMKHPLSENTREDIKQCLKLIAARELELKQQKGTAIKKPYFSDQEVSLKVDKD